MNQCSICLLIPEIQDSKSLECHHIFCQKCIQHWLKIKNTCPMCGFQVFSAEKQCKEQANIFDFQQKVEYISRQLNHLNSILKLKKKQSNKVKSTISKSDIFRFEVEFCEIQDLYFDLLNLSRSKQNAMEVIIAIEQINFKIIILSESLDPRSYCQKQEGKREIKLKVTDFDQDFPEIESFVSSKSKKKSKAK